MLNELLNMFGGICFCRMARKPGKEPEHAAGAGNDGTNEPKNDGLMMSN